ncbi:MAG: hypothetical protein ABSA65_16305 [Acidimicrobiales bacterium]
MFAAIAEATSAAIVAGLISGGVVLLGMLLAEWLGRKYERRQRIFVLRLTERDALDDFFATLDNTPAGLSRYLRSSSAAPILLLAVTASSPS